MMIHNISGGMIMYDKAITYLAEDRERLLTKLDEFLSIPSVSTDSNFKNDIKKAADFLESYLQEIGFENIEQKDTGGHPLVYAEYNGAGADKPTVLFYGHYDVQPVDPIDERSEERRVGKECRCRVRE